MIIQIITVLISVPAAMVSLFDLYDKVSTLIKRTNGNTEAQD